VDPRGWKVLKYLVYFTYPYRYQSGDFVHSHFHLEMCILSGREDPITSYGGSKRGGGV
jgi:hypothetical protein